MPRTLFRTRIKFCGLTRPGDVRLAGELGADAIGFVFAGESPRTVRAEEARAMRNALAPLVDAVAVFRDNPAEEVRDVVRLVRPSLLQFHGDEDDAFCRNFGVPYVKALALGSIPMTASTALQSRFPNASAFLFDGDRAGTGEVFDWSKIPTGLGRPFILAGGLTPANVHGAVVENLPWGVDVSTGIESAPGLKDGELMRKFVSEVRRADCEEDPDTECEA